MDLNHPLSLASCYLIGQPREPVNWDSDPGHSVHEQSYTVIGTTGESTAVNFEDNLCDICKQFGSRSSKC